MTTSSLPSRGSPDDPPLLARPAPARARLAAGAIDVAVDLSAVVLLSVLLHLAAGRSLPLSSIVALVIVIAARGLLLARTGWSLGGRVMRVRLVDARTMAPSPLGVFIYTDLTVVVTAATLGLGVIFLIRSVNEDPQHRGWHDRISGLTALSVPRTQAQPAPADTDQHTGHSVTPQAGSVTPQAGTEPGELAGQGAPSEAASDRPLYQAPTHPGASATARAAASPPSTLTTTPHLRAVSAPARPSEAAAAGTVRDHPSRALSDAPASTGAPTANDVPSSPMEEPPHRAQSRSNQSPTASATSSHSPSADPGVEPASGVHAAYQPRREPSFPTGDPRDQATHAAQLSSTSDTTRAVPADGRTAQALIDSVPWSSVPTVLDSTTMDSLPDTVRTAIAESPAAPEHSSSGTSAGSAINLLDPQGVPSPAGAAPAAPVSSGQSPAPASRTTQQPVAPPTIEVPELRAAHPPAPVSGTASTPPQAAPGAPATTSHGTRHHGSLSPSLSVRLVPQLGGEPLVVEEPTVIGRDPDNISSYPGAERIALTDPTRSVSKTHAAIFPLLDGVWVTDLHSTNGTKVERRDGSTVQAVPDVALAAHEGETVFFGRIGFRVEVAS
ncbi:FHA domain-containing protein [Actinomyces lilanjuaniae]|uniref:FHA domain-containing protein n=1 Tax=Actinomyces lilanjuaniae TaxID=2321394 RepID=A0ABN5PQH8_9ACTO|nr:RDD family protein [Actinomyces lilanjuaniae]AYD90431.1 FHA domain-containing protein [Actinomyces lilanjuaniae]